MTVQVYYSDKNTDDKTSKTGRMGDEILGVGRVTLAELTAGGGVVVKLIDPERYAGSVALSSVVA